MQFIKKKTTLIACFLTLGALALFTSCMPGPSDPGSQLAIGIQIKSIDSTLYAGNDSLTIDKVRFIHSGTFFTVEGEEGAADLYLLENGGSAFQVTFKEDIDNRAKLLYRGFFKEGVYQQLTFNIAPLDSVDNIGPSANIDDIFKDNDYSMVINGTFNGKEFTQTVSKKLSYPLLNQYITVTSTAKFYQLIITASPRDWFMSNASSGFIDPTNTMNDSLIIQNIERRGFTLEKTVQAR